jgi:hypothetical protein
MMQVFGGNIPNKYNVVYFLKTYKQYGTRFYKDTMGSRLHNHVVAVTLTLTLAI